MFLNTPFGCRNWSEEIFIASRLQEWRLILTGIDGCYLSLVLTNSFSFSVCVVTFPCRLSSPLLVSRYLLSYSLLFPLTFFFVFCVVFPYSTPDSHESVNAWNLSLVLFLISFISKKISFVFFKHLILRICRSLVHVLINFTFNICRLSTHFSMTFDKVSEYLSSF